MRALSVILAVLAASVVLRAEVTLAHGPCNCLYPIVGQPGTEVIVASAGRVLRPRTNLPAYKVIFNPPPSAYGTAGSYSGYASAYQPEARTTTVFSRSDKRPVRGARFSIPRAARPGLYLVMIFDGSEGGQHYTWDYFHVLGDASASPSTVSEPPQPQDTQLQDSDSDLVPALFGAGLAALAIVIVGWGWRRFRPTRRSETD